MVRVTFLFLIIVFSSCGIKPVTVKKIEGARLKEYSLKGGTVELDLLVNNPNPIGFSIYRSDMNIKVNGIDMGKAGITKKIKIKRNAEKKYTVTIHSDFSKLGPAALLSLGQLMATGKVNATVAVDGELKTGNLFYKKRFPVDIKERIDLSR